jgi:hypothetical protein
MTKPDHEYEAPGDAHTAIATFLDGEDVDARALKDALANAEGRDYFLDLLVLRRSVHDTFEPLPVRPESSWCRRRVVAVAAAIVMALGAGYFAGRQLQRADAAAGAISPVVVEFGQVAPPAPAPTKVIELKPGLNWKEQGGN